MAEARAILAEVVPESQINPALLEAANKALANFDYYDKSKDGRLSYDEFKKIPETANEAEFVFKLMDLDHNKYISKKEFIQFIAADSLGNTYKPYFDSLDKNGDGGIDVAEFERFMADRGFPKEKVHELVRKMDTDKSGKVEYKEFRDYFARL